MGCRGDLGAQETEEKYGGIQFSQNACFDSFIKEIGALKMPDL
jgi:hypothetical protein